jgi:hypothetical protein
MVSVDIDSGGVLAVYASRSRSMLIALNFIREVHGIDGH